MGNIQSRRIGVIRRKMIKIIIGIVAVILIGIIIIHKTKFLKKLKKFAELREGCKW